ncbi:hypothetical protein [Micromonospora olivasterospora]|uniref:hypothetical protein n=1 Tax=Micromonospora olivasterospora TaxID=1880 RepID=UPI00119D4724|nr:hypothetical protein [Micromonospora olivasterospora]
MLAYDLNALEVLADRVRTLLVPELVQAIRAVRAAGEGEVYDRFVAQTAPFVEMLDRVADLKVNLAQAMRGFLNQMELTDRQALVMFVFMMTELAVAFAMAFFLPVEAAAHIVKVRTIIQTILRSSMVRAAASSTAIQMLFVPGSSLLAQISMLADGLMSGVDWGQVGKQALYGLAVAGVSTAAGPALARFAGAVGGGLSHLGVSGSTRDLLTSLSMVPVSEVGVEVVGGIAASYLVDGHYDTGSLGPDALSGALSGSGELAATGAGMGARRGAVGLGFNPTRPRWRMPDGVGFTADGRPVAPLPPPPPVTADPSAYLPEVGDPAGAGSGGQALVPVPPVPVPALSAPDLSAPAWSVPDLPAPSWSVPSFSVPLVPVPEWVAAAGALVVEQWQRFQRELVDHYGGLLAGMGQARQFLAALPVSVERLFAGWVDARRGDRAVAAFLSAVALPVPGERVFAGWVDARRGDRAVAAFLSAAALTEGYLTGVRQRAVARMVEALAFSGGRIPAEVRARQVIAGLPAEFDRQALRSLAHLAVQHHIDQYLAAGLPTGPGTPTGAGVSGGAGAVVPSAGVLRAVEGGVWSQVDRGVDVILGAPAVLPGVVAGPDAGQVSAVASVVRQVVVDLPARFSAAAVPGVTAAAAGVATVDVEEGGRVGGPTVPVMSERHIAAAAGLARAQFTALARRYGVDLAGHAALVASFQREWVDGYHRVLVSAGGSVTPGTAEVVGALGTVPGGAGSRVGGMSIVDVVSVGDTASVSDVSVASGAVFSPDLGSRDTDSAGFGDTGSIGDVSVLDEPVGAGAAGFGEPAVAATGSAGQRIHELASGGYGRASDAQLRRLAADIGIQAASPDGVLPRLFEVSRDIVMADTFSGVYFADPAAADPDAAAADRTAARALPWVRGWFTIAGHRNLAERLADDPVRQALFLRMLTASPAWRHAVAQARQRGGDAPDIMLVWCDAAWQAPGQATSFGEWLRTRLRARRLMSSTHEVDQIPGELRPHVDEPVRSVLFSDASVELFGPDLVEAVRTADIVQNDQEPGVRWPDQEDFAAAGGRHRWAGNTSHGQSPDPAEDGDPSGPGPASAAQWMWGPSRDPGAELPVPGPALEPDRPQGEDLSWLDDWDALPMPGMAPAPPAGTGLPWLPWLPWPLDDPDAPTASSWPAGWAEPGWPVPGMGVTDGHGAAISTDFGQPRIDDQAGEGSGNLGDWAGEGSGILGDWAGEGSGNLGDWAGEGGNLGDWATYQGPDMDWQPSLASWPAVARTDAGTVHVGDILHHPADEPPTTPAAPHPDQPQPQPAAGSRRVRDPGEARRLFDQHAGHIATTTRQREPLRQLWNALIDRMDDNGIITAGEPDLAEATSTPQPTVHRRIGVLRDRGLLQLVQEAHGRGVARYGVSDPGQPRQAPLPAPPEGTRWLRDPGGARALFDQHAGHIATTTPQRDRLRQLWNALIDRMDDNGIITASVSDLVEATSTPRPTVQARIGVLRDRGLLQLVQEGRGGGVARYGVSDPGPPRQAPLPAPPEGSQWLRDPGGALALFDQHAGHIATTTPQPEPLRQLWNALIDRMDDNGIITASLSDLAEATSTPQPTVRHRIGALRDRGLLQLVQEAHGGGAARYGVSDPGPPRQAPLPAPPEGSQWVRDPDGARGLFDQHVGHIATTTRQREPLRQLWHALIDRMDDNGIITASLSDLAEATSTPQPTVRHRIGVLRDRGLLQLVQEAHGRVAARYGVSDPGQPRQAPPPGPALGPDRPQGEDLSWLDHGATVPMPGPVPAPPAGTGLPGLPGPLDDPDAPTASSWPAGWAEPGWPVPGMGVTDGHGAAISIDFGQPGIDDQAGEGSGNLGDWAGEGGNLGDWATYEVGPAGSLDVDPADLLYLLEAVGTEPDPGPQPMDPPRPQAPPGPTSWSQPSGDQPSQSPGTQSFPPGPGMQDPAPQSPMPGPAPAPPADTGLPGLPGPLDDPDAPTASSWPAGWAEPGWPVPGMGVTDGHGATISTDFDQPGIDDQASDGGNLGDWATYQGPDMDWQPSLAPSPAVTRTDAGTVHVGDILHHPADEPPTTPASPHPDQPQPQPAADSRRVRDPGEARALFDQHAGHIATTTRQREPLRKLWNALIDRMDDNGIITASEPALAAATSTLRQTVHRRIGVLRDRGLLQRVQEGRGRGVARYGVSDPGPPRQAPLPAPPEGSQWLRDPGEARRLFDQHAGHIATTTPQREQLRQLWHALIDRMDDNGIITASESDLAAATSTPQPTVHDRIGVLRDRGLLQRVQEGRGGGAARYGVSDPGQPRRNVSRD